VSVSTPEFTPVVRPSAAVPELAPFIGNGRPPKLPRRRLGKYASATLGLVLLTTLGASALRLSVDEEPVSGPLAVAPVVIYAPIRLDGAVVRGAALDRAAAHKVPLRYGDPVEVALTAYCLRGLTRRDHYVREGIVASDPKLFPLGRYVEIYVGREYYGRFLVDDTGRAIKGNILDIWTPTCREARVFGRTKGTAVLVPRPNGASRDTLLTGRLGGTAH
jgi:3D (Asp-Asp-Asp) domain-containing protein